MNLFYYCQNHSTGSMKPVFCGNFEYDAREGDLERLFRKYGKVERVDMKAGEPFFSFFLSSASYYSVFVVNLNEL